MKLVRQLIVHGGLLSVAAALAVTVWTQDEKVATVARATVEVWGGTPEQISQVTYESDGKTVVLNRKQDEAGAYYVVNVKKSSASSPSSNPHTKDPHAQSSSGPEKAGTKEDSFIAVKTADSLLQGLAPLMALRAVGKIPAARAPEFGLDKPKGKILIQIAGKKRTLELGGPTPGSVDRYVREADSGEVFAIAGDAVQSLSSAEHRLVERQFHEFAPEDVARVRISKGEKAREVSRLEGKANAWADLGKSEQNETVGNWMTKLDRLRVQDYSEKLPSPPKPEDLVVRIEYFGKSKSIGYLELYKIGNATGKPQYFVKTEYSRWYAEVLNSIAEQVEQDLASVLSS